MSTVAPLFRFTTGPGLQLLPPAQGLPAGGRTTLRAGCTLLYGLTGQPGSYILQQFYRGGGLHMEQITLSLQQYTLLSPNVPYAFPGFQYSLQGRVIAGLPPMPLVAGSYTLQYIPAGGYPLLAPPGRHRFFFLSAENILELLQVQHPPVQQLLAHANANSAQAYLAERLPITSALLQELDELLALPAANGHTPIQMAQRVHELMSLYHFQKLAPEPPGSQLVAEASCVIAGNTCLKERELLQLIRQHLGLMQGALNYYWKQQCSYSIGKYITRLRMEYALYLLCTTKYDIDNI